MTLGIGTSISALLDGNPELRRYIQRQSGVLDGKDSIEQFENFSVNELGNVKSDIDQSGFQQSIFDTAAGFGRAQGARAAKRNAQRAADRSRESFARRTEGAALTARQQKAAKSQLGLNRAVTVADAGVASRRASYGAQRAAQGAGAGFGDMIFGQQMAALAGLGNAEGQRQQLEEQRRANKKASRNSMIGSIIGVVGGIFGSSEEYKDKVEEAPSLLEKLKDVRIDKWRYKGAKPEHIGPYAEEFNRTFGVGSHRDAIDVISMLGVTIGSIKELNEKVEALGIQ